MFTKAVALSSIAALAGQALAANPHRHLHQVERRDIVTSWETVYTTVYVTETGAGGQESVAPTAIPVTAEKEISTISSNTPAALAAASTSVPVAVSISTSAAASVAPSASSPAAQVLDQTSSLLAVPTTLASVKPTVQLSSSASSAAASTTSVAPPAQPTTTSPATSAAQSTTATASAAPSAAPAPPAGAPFLSKKGIAYNEAALAEVFEAACTDCSWCYNWGANSDGLIGSCTFVPQLWGTADSYTSTWSQTAEAAVAAGAPLLFSLNEPDMPSQSNVSPQDAAQAQATYMAPYKGKTLIGAPAISNSNLANEGIQWLEQFVTACDSTEGCYYDVCNCHWYNVITEAADLLNQLELVHQTCGGKPVVLTEFAPIDGDDDQISQFLETVIPQLDALDYLYAYSYFMASTGVLMSSDTTLSTYGLTYASTV